MIDHEEDRNDALMILQQQTDAEDEMSKSMIEFVQTYGIAVNSSKATKAHQKTRTATGLNIQQQRSRLGTPQQYTMASAHSSTQR